MPKKRYLVTLTADERTQLEQLLRGGKVATRKATRARILLKASDGWSDQRIAEALNVGRATVERTRRRFVEENLAALDERPRPGNKPKLDARAEARLIAEACSVAPDGRERWTLSLLADRVVQLKLADSYSYEAVRRVLKNELKPWLKEQWCIPEVSTEFVACMEDVLELYAEPYDPQRPKVNFDETSKQLIAETRQALPTQPGRPQRYDYEYERGGTRNLFLFTEPQAGWRHVEVTRQRTMLDFAHQMRWLVDVAYPQAEVIRVVMDNLNTHKAASLYEAFSPEEARRIIKKLEFHYTPKHGSWLNMAEIELSVLQRQCLTRRIPDEAALVDEIAAWEKERNEKQATIDWRFSVTDARDKLKRLYPSRSS